MVISTVDPLARRKPSPSGPGQGAPLVFNVLSYDSNRRTPAGSSKVTWSPEIAARLNCSVGGYSTNRWTWSAPPLTSINFAASDAHSLEVLLEYSMCAIAEKTSPILGREHVDVQGRHR